MVENVRLPLVTIGIPLYNEEKYILETVESAINQTYKNIEIIISDNCSTDFSLKVIHEIVQQNSNIRLINQPVNLGAVGNFDFLKNYIENSIKEIAKDKKKIMVLFDSNHSHEHVLEELKAYANLTTVGSYCVVFDTVVEDLPKDIYNDRPWGVGSNPKTAVFEFLKTNSDFEIDKGIDNKILISVAPDGYLKRVK